MEYSLTGTVVFVGATTQISEKFRRRDIVLRSDQDKYPQEVKFQVTQDRCTLLDTLQVGQVATVKFNIRGRAYDRREGGTDWFTSLEIWRVEGSHTSSPRHDYSGVTPASSPSENNGPGPNFDDVPF